MIDQFQTAAEKVDQIGRQHPQCAYTAVNFSVMTYPSGAVGYQFNAHVIMCSMLDPISVQGQTWEELYRNLELEIQVSTSLNAA